MSIEIRNVNKSFGSFHALRDVSLDINSGELVALLGPSGCGKTTLLRIIAGLESADQGSIAFAGEDATDVHVRDRKVGFVFQHYALFRNMTVFENVAFGLRVKPKGQRPSEDIIKKKVHDLLNLVQLDWLADRFPSQLSGGQRQRIALARALAVEPKVLLLDEPFGALDAKVRKELRRWLRRLHDELHVTSVFVTHDQEEALEVADRVVLMNSGQVEQIGEPQEVWSNPVSPFVYRFLGDVNVIPGTGYVRPHEMAISRASSSAHHSSDSTNEDVKNGTGQQWPSITTQLQRAILVGPIARLELTQASDNDKPLVNQLQNMIEVHLPVEQFKALNLQNGETVIATPLRAKAFG
jgi:sulfate/thiosulfate transport system ATP-binding protein